MFTRRQKQIFVLLSQGLSNREIACILRISDNTVKMHLRNMYMRLGVSSRGKLIAKLQHATATATMNVWQFEEMAKANVKDNEPGMNPASEAVRREREEEWH